MRPLLGRTLGLLALVAVPMVAVYAVAAEPLLEIVFGGQATLAAGALPWLGLAMSLLACSYLAVVFLFALHRSGFVWFLAAAAIAEPVALLAGGDTLTAVAFVLLGLDALLAAALTSAAFTRHRGAAPVVPVAYEVRSQDRPKMAEPA